MWVWTKHAEDEWRAKAKAKGLNVDLRRAGHEVTIAGEKPTVSDIEQLQARGYVEQKDGQATTIRRRKEWSTQRLTQDKITKRWQIIEDCIDKGITSATQVGKVIGVEGSVLRDFVRKHPEGRGKIFSRVYYDGEKLQAAIVKAGYTSVNQFDIAVGKQNDVYKIIDGTKTRGTYCRAKRMADALGCKVQDITKEGD